MKNNRQDKILEIIEAEPIETQEQLIERLASYGIKSTQATISRDIKQLHLMKEPTGDGSYRYAVSAHKTKLNFAERFRIILRESLLKVDRAQNIVVLKAITGLGSAVGAAFDGMDIPMMVGSIAGDDTVMIVMRDEQSAIEFCEEISLMQK
ncbi:MAG: arginine repressor [Oscillospiraceae bacterium]|nr:arginine repressor [Oscillospiraceae bacterium]MBR6738879.1 arginine repressor [Oscillospiraceae bacterium]